MQENKNINYILTKNGVLIDIYANIILLLQTIMKTNNKTR